MPYIIIKDQNPFFLIKAFAAGKVDLHKPSKCYFLPPLTATWNVLLSCLTMAPHFHGDWPLLQCLLDNIGVHCMTDVPQSVKNEDTTDTLHLGQHECMDSLSSWVYIVCGCLHSAVCASQCVPVLGAQPCLCVSSLIQPAESAVSLHLTAGQKLEQEMDSDSVSASHKFLFSYSDTKDNISALH